MTEPIWNDVKTRLGALTMRELRSIKTGWFNGCLGGVSSKSEVVNAMVAQMHSWWNLPDGLGVTRVRNVLHDLQEIEGRDK